MSSDKPVISVRGLGKDFRISHLRTNPTTLAEAVVSRLRKPLRSRSYEVFQALDDVSFEVARGEILGVIGRNGAGKSTLLKVLSRITAPTRGEARIRGRVGSLLEVGTGFSGELTGRENIFLNGAILGMRRREINRRFDEIVDFAGVEQFLDTPVKRYSSGMYVRLAFAVAAHLNPEVLIVDEVLAVGDAEFQRKCLGRMKDLSTGEGRTVLFVSHNMAAITELCGSAILLRDGRVVAHGDCQETVRTYLQTADQAGAGGVDLSSNGQGKVVVFTHARAESCDGHQGSSFDVRRPIRLVFNYEVRLPVSGFELSARVEKADGMPIFTTLLSDATRDEERPLGPGSFISSVTIPGMFLMPDDYVVTFAAHMPVGEVFDMHEQAFGFTVEDTGTPYGSYGNLRAVGAVILLAPWETRSCSADLHPGLEPSPHQGNEGS